MVAYSEVGQLDSDSDNNLIASLRLANVPVQQNTDKEEEIDHVKTAAPSEKCYPEYFVNFILVACIETKTSRNALKDFSFKSPRNSDPHKES